jgi:hypothetical protein
VYQSNLLGLTEKKTKERDKRQDGTLFVGAENCVRGQGCASKKNNEEEKEASLVYLYK